MTNIMICGLICFRDDYILQVFLKEGRKEYYLVQQFTKSYKFIVKVRRGTKNGTTR